MIFFYVSDRQYTLLCDIELWCASINTQYRLKISQMRLKKWIIELRLQEV